MGKKLTRKITFKSTRSTGLARVMDSRGIVIVKWLRKQFGQITYNDRLQKWEVGVRVEDVLGENCKWKWITLVAKFDDVDDAKQWFRLKADRLFEVYKIALEE